MVSHLLHLLDVGAMPDAFGISRDNKGSVCIG
jgi:hypothetical protein